MKGWKTINKLSLSVLLVAVMAWPVSSIARPQHQGPMQGACKADVEQICKDAVKSAAEKRAERSKANQSN
ncbi:MAG: hypothetical protein KGN37_01115 [Burkholderiales bacterium]|nr:hypothetical protein [Burkholderiales bacterium]MDE2431433.1 hypothetical protein [Burkholderiales bacterium]